MRARNSFAMWLGRRLLALVRGPEAEFLRGDIEQELERRRPETGDRCARRWYVRQALAAAWSWWRPSNAWIRRGRAAEGVARPRSPRSDSTDRLPPTERIVPENSLREVLIDDVRHVWRRMASWRGSMLAAATMLGLGVGLTTAMFTLADSLLIRPVPFRDADRLVQLMMVGEVDGLIAVPATIFNAWGDSPAFESVEAANEEPILLETSSGPIERPGALVTPGLFEMLGVRPLRGRLFVDGEGAVGAGDVALISEGLWRSAFGADPGLIGERVVIGESSVQVVGVMPDDFRFPEGNTQIWLPIDYSAPPPARANDRPIAFVVFDADVPRNDALRVASEAAHAAAPEFSTFAAAPRPLGLFDRSAFDDRAIPLLFGGVALVFVVLCANGGSLLLVRFSARRREFATCAALGASRARLLRQALLETISLGALGSGIGVALALAFVALSRAVLPAPFLQRTLNPLNLDTRALLVACGFGLLATLAAGLPAAFAGTRVSLRGGLNGAGHGGSESRGSRLLSNGLVVTEVALACALLVGATMLVQSFVNIVSADRGLDSAGVLTARVRLPTSDFPDPAARRATQMAVQDELRSLPGVQQMALSFGVPPDGAYIRFGDDWLSDVPEAEPMELIVNSYDVAADYFELYGIPLLRGRTFRAGDTPFDVVAGERFAELMWPGLDPIGRTFMRGEDRFQIIGVVGETLFPSVDAGLERPEYYNAAGVFEGGFWASLRCTAECPTPAVIRQRLSRVSPLVDVRHIGPLEAEYAEQLAPPRAAAALAATFAAVALTAAAGGLFGVLLFAVGRRRREFGIRTALGATDSQLRRLVLRDGFVLAACGILLGGGLAWALARSLTSLQYGVSPADPSIWLCVGGILTLTAILASWWPARRAAFTDPGSLLRDD